MAHRTHRIRLTFLVVGLLSPLWVPLSLDAFTPKATPAPLTTAQLAELQRFAVCQDAADVQHAYRALIDAEAQLAADMAGRLPPLPTDIDLTSSSSCLLGSQLTP